ncbi:MAG: DUF5640 domain-containing protein [Christensenellaceae bacterium]
MKGCSNDNTAAITGTFIFNDSTYYEFDGEGSGYMSLSTTRYAYAYSISGDKLKLDFDNEAVRDCEYTFIYEGDTLTLVGGEGTTGGTYTLRRQEND